jgi:hypothetical protein
MNPTVQRLGAPVACLVAGIIAAYWHMETRAADSKYPKAITIYVERPETKIGSFWSQKAAAVAAVW